VAAVLTIRWSKVLTVIERGQVSARVVPHFSYTEIQRVSRSTSIAINNLWVWRTLARANSRVGFVGLEMELHTDTDTGGRDSNYLADQSC